MKKLTIFILLLSLIFISTGCNRAEKDDLSYIENIFYSFYQNNEGAFFQIINENEEDVILEFDSEQRYELEILDTVTDNVLWRLSNNVSFERYEEVQKITIPANGKISEKIDMNLIRNNFTGEIKYRIYSTAKNLDALSPLTSFKNLENMPYVNPEISPVNENVEILRVEDLSEEDKEWIDWEIEKNKMESIEDNVFISIQKNDTNSLVYIYGKEGVKLSFKGVEADSEKFYVNAFAGENYEDKYILIRLNTDKVVVTNIIED